MGRDAGAEHNQSVAPAGPARAAIWGAAQEQGKVRKFIAHICSLEALVGHKKLMQSSKCATQGKNVPYALLESSLERLHGLATHSHPRYGTGAMA